jgi:membrane protein
MEYRRKNGAYAASSIAFYLLFSLIPFVLLSLSVAAVIARDESSFVQVFDEWFRANFPAQADGARLSLLNVFHHRGSIGLIGLFWLFFSASRLVASIETGLDRVMGNEKTRSGVLTTLASVALIFLAAVLFLAAVASTVVLDFFTGLHVSFLPRQTPSVVEAVLSALVGAAISVAMLFGIYRLAPSQGMTSREALWAAVVATLMWQGARHAFVWYATRQLAEYEWIYGPLAGFLLALLWAYVFGNALLMGACVVRSK